MSGLPDIDHSIEIEAPIERVWTALTDEGLAAHWLGCIGFRPVVGTLFHMQPDPAKAGSLEGATHCEVEALEPPRRLVFSWFLPGTPKTHVEIVLSAAAHGTTTARLVHTGWDQFDADQLRDIHRHLSGGWRSGVLPGLKRVAEGLG
jgi:uncharacterized protein YndB with AHSA1/START domain